MDHKKLTSASAQGVHTIIAYVYADVTERTSATGFTVEDIGKVAKQLSDGSKWMLDSIAPSIVWTSFGGSSPAAAGAGLYSDRPVAGTVGRLYTPIDLIGVHYYDDGGQWIPLVDGELIYGSRIPPAAASFTPDHILSGYSLTQEGDALRFSSNVSNNSQISSWMKSPLSAGGGGEWCLTMAIAHYETLFSGSINTIALVLGDASTHYMVWELGFTNFGVMSFNGKYWSNYSTKANELGTYTRTATRDMVWLRWRFDGALYYWEYKFGGLDMWQLFLSSSFFGQIAGLSSNPFGPTRYGIGCDLSGAAPPYQSCIIPAFFQTPTSG